MAAELADFKVESATLRNQDLTVRRLEERNKALEAQLAEKVMADSLAMQRPCRLAAGHVGLDTSRGHMISASGTSMRRADSASTSDGQHRSTLHNVEQYREALLKDNELEAAAARPAVSDAPSTEEVAEREAALEAALGEARQGLDHMRRLHQSAQVRA